MQLYSYAKEMYPDFQFKESQSLYTQMITLTYVLNWTDIQMYGFMNNYCQIVHDIFKILLDKRIKCTCIRTYLSRKETICSRHLERVPLFFSIYT